MTDVVRIPFHDDEILALDVDGEPYIVLKPAIEGLGLDYWSQIEKLRKRSWAATSNRRVQVSEQGQRREMVTCDVRTFLMLLATIDEHRVSEDVRAKLVTYQSEVADAIHQYWTDGGALNPRATADQLQLIAARAEAQARVLRVLDGIVDPAWLEAKARHVAARALGEEPEVEPSDRPLTVGEYLTDRGVTGEALRSLSPTFGKALKRAYMTRYGQKPKPVERFVDGALREVAGYTEAHRSLFDQVWAELIERRAS